MCFHVPRGVGFGTDPGRSPMQKYMYEKAMAQETRNGGTSTLNNNNGVDNSKKKLLIVLDILCLLLGKFTLFRVEPLHGLVPVMMTCV